MTVEDAVKLALEHRERTRAILAELVAGDIPPDQAILREMLVIAVIIAIDDQCLLCGVPRLPDAELPALVRAIDGIADRLYQASLN